MCFGAPQKRFHALVSRHFGDMEWTWIMYQCESMIMDLFSDNKTTWETFTRKIVCRKSKWRPKDMKYSSTQFKHHYTKMDGDKLSFSQIHSVTGNKHFLWSDLYFDVHLPTWGFKYAENSIQICFDYSAMQCTIHKYTGVLHLLLIRES